MVLGWTKNTVVPRELELTTEFSAFTVAAEEAIAENSINDLLNAANGIARLLREVVALRKQSFQQFPKP